MPVLTFPKDELSRVLNGEKTHTMRSAHAGIINTKPGAKLVMQFGARNNPTTLRTTVSSVERVTPARILAWSDVPDGDPRSTQDTVEQLTELLWNGSAEDQLMAYTAEYLGIDVILMIGEAQLVPKKERDEVVTMLIGWNTPPAPQA